MRPRLITLGTSKLWACASLTTTARCRARFRLVCHSNCLGQSRRLLKHGSYGVGMTLLPCIVAICMAALLSATSLLNGQSASEPPSPASPSVTGSPIPGLPGYGVDLGLDAASGQILELLVYRGQQQFQVLKICTPEPVPRESPVGTSIPPITTSTDITTWHCKLLSNGATPPIAYGCTTRRRGASLPASAVAAYQ